MNAVVVRGVQIGCGQPKICVSIIGRSRMEIMSQAQSLANQPVDIVEWRVDYFEEFNDYIAVKDILNEMNNILMGKPILFTFRTSMEGGQKWVTAEQYSDLIYTAVSSGVVDIVDVELYMGDKYVESMINQLHRMDVKVIVSNHDFDKTPPKQKMIDRLKNMEYLGADIAKLAVMAKNKKDVIELLDTTVEAETRMNIPVVTMSMGGYGMITRVSGEFFQSAITFGAGVAASAPGQLTVNDLHNVLTNLHKNLEVNM